MGRVVAGKGAAASPCHRPARPDDEHLTKLGFVAAFTHLIPLLAVPTHECSYAPHEHARIDEGQPRRLSHL